MFDVACCVYRGGNSISPQRLADNYGSKEHIVMVDVQLC